MNWRAAALALGGAASVACAAVVVRRMEPKAEASPVTTVAAAPPARTDANAVPVLVELFTSEGCSSCPPADGVLADLERTQPVAGARVVPLGLHVDYWDRLGWTDPFSSARATERQRAYGVLGGGSYTPQAVIDGRAHTVGSRRAAVELAIVEAARRPHATVAIDVAPRAGADASRPFAITVAIGALPAGSAADAEAMVALTQNAVRVAVARGENGGKALEHTAVARELVSVGPVPASGASRRVSLKAPPGVSAPELRVVAFVQERKSRHVLGASSRDLEAR
jgi:hypothetical protein